MGSEYKDNFEKSFEKELFNGNDKKINRKRKQREIAMEVILALVLVWAVIATLFSVYLVVFEGKFQNGISDTGNQAIEIVSSNDMEDKIFAAKQEARTEFLNELKQKMLTGNGSVQMLREYFPEEIVYLKGGEYKFFPIVDALNKNPYANIDFKQDEETKIVEAYDDGNLVSSFGIDVSKHNGEIDWETLKTTDVDFAIIRLGFRGFETGKLVLDEQFENNLEGVNRVGMDYGVYFYSQAISEEEAIEEAEFLLENIEGYVLDFPIIIDIELSDAYTERNENLTIEQRTDFCIAFCKRIEEAGYETMIYGNVVTFMELLDITRLEQYKKWFAFYDDTYYYPYDFEIWQYSNTGILSGINEKVDFNILFEKDKIYQP